MRTSGHVRRGGPGPVLGLAVAALACLLLAGPAARAVTQDEIDQAVERGVAYLKAQGSWGGYNGFEIGNKCLVALTLLECRVPPSDAKVQGLVRELRGEAITARKTYDVSLAILLFDRLGDPADVPLIESLAVRLLGGQRHGGGWSYDCPMISDAEVNRLKTLDKNRNELRSGKDLPKGGAGARRELPREIKEQLANLARNAAKEEELTTSDNSNTQFAVLAAWVARRHGIPVEDSFRLVEGRFKSSQCQDGGWPYYHTGTRALMSNSTPAMTCSGLLGLGLAYGVAREKDKAANPAADPVIRGGLLYLGAVIDHPQARQRVKQPIPVIRPGMGNGKSYYFLWSLERVGMAYGLDTIGDKDWYQWGAEILLANQDRDGGWKADYEQGGCDTCFALLFLRRANLAKDLTASLKGQVRDPRTGTLEKGGVGGAALQRGEGLPPAIASAQERKPAPARPAPGTVDPAVASLGDELVKAPAGKQEQVLKKLRDTKGSDYTLALAYAIPRLEGQSRAAARDALAERLTRLTAASLGGYLNGPDPELQRAALLACAMKEPPVKAHLPRMIDLLADPNPTVARASHAALTSLTGQDFGPKKGATPEEVRRSIAEWKEWLKKAGS